MLLSNRVSRELLVHISTLSLYKTSIHPTLFILLFRAYAVVDMNQVLLYLPPEKQSVNVKRHLESEVSELLLVGFIQ